MANWSVPLKQGWRLRVTTGSSLGKEFDLPPGQYTLGSAAPSSILIPDGSIAPQHLSLDVRADHIQARDCSGGRGMFVNGQRQSSCRIGPGDKVLVGKFGFDLVNSSLPAAAPAGKPSPLAGFRKLPHFAQAGIILAAVAAILCALLRLTHNPIIVPVTLLAMGAVVPGTMIFFLIERYDKTGISFHTLALTFLAGGTIGTICTLIPSLIVSGVTGTLLLLPIFAALFEEPAKLLGTAWRWKHPGYDRPMDGLILGTVSGLGFAVFETAGYGLMALLEEGMSGMGLVMLLRALTSPFGHGLWSGIVAAAFWQNRCDFKTALTAPSFRYAMLWAVGLHALWNVSAISPVGYLAIAASAYLSVREYRKLLAHQGYRP